MLIELFLMRRILLIALLFSTCSVLCAQEVLVGLSSNPLVKPQPKQEQLENRFGAPSTPIELPFVDDFSEKNPYPNTNLWESRGIFINTNYGIHSPTIGVATFDAQGDDGQFYSHIGSSSDTADVLTTYPIQLAGTSNVVLSFFVQAGGLGDIPESGDLLILEFFSPDDNQWHLAWTASAVSNDSLVEKYYLPDPAYPTIKEFKGRIDTSFCYVAMAINEPRFLRDGFRFRFSNLASMATSPVPSREYNCDHWNIDFVYLDKNRSVADELLPDVAICEPQTSLALAYTSIPVTHLNTSDARQKLFGDPMKFTLVYQNLGWGTRNVTRRFSIAPLSGSNNFPQDYLGGSENIFNNQKFVREYTFEPYDFSNGINADSASYEIKSYLVTDLDTSPLRAALRKNDTTTYVQQFYNYYSYDDGTAENGYGLFGVGSSNGRVAVRYTSYATDSLRALSMYFNMARDSANAKPLFVTIWSDNDGIPGEILYSQKINSPAFSDEQNEFIFYKLPKAIEIRRGQTFYIGWIQTTETFFNVGFDVNNDRSDITLYSLGNVWYPSSYKGALMMRPVFGKASAIPDDAIPLPAPPAAPVKDEELFLYPNPAVDVVNLRIKKNDREVVLPLTCTIYLYDIHGQLVRTTTTSNGSFSVLGLPNGLYVVRVMENNKFKATRKILVAH